LSKSQNATIVASAQEWIGSQNATIVELVQEWIGSGMDWFAERDDSRIGSGMDLFRNGFVSQNATEIDWFRTIVGFASINTVAGGHGNVKQRASTTHKFARTEVYSES